MHSLYNFLIHVATGVLKLLALFSKKLRTFVRGRNFVFDTLKEKIAPTDKTLWFHCASLGEFEQGVPIITAIKDLKPDHKIVVSFFSPSGFEVKKNTPLADVVVYLPMDTASNARKFIAAVHPSMAFFIKYEFWPNYLFELEKKAIPTLLISGVFNKNHIFFKPYGGFMRKALRTIDHFFVQDANSKLLLENLGLKNVSVSGDTRFDRVSQQLKMDNCLQFAADFKGNNLCIVCGSTWPEDEALLLDYINDAPPDVKFIIAPHKIESDQIERFRKSIQKKSIRHSEIDQVDVSKYPILIIDCIGLLSKLYSYADIAYVGGAAGKTGLHNILEPATFGLPIVIGKNYSEFPEAIQLENLQGLFSVRSSEECKDILSKLVQDSSFRSKIAKISGDFVDRNTGATEKIINYVSPTFKEV
jgi:3-deoxy-D-manno-octulosonic-acid transferase